jgi:hypothetical protein
VSDEETEGGEPESTAASRERFRVVDGELQKVDEDEAAPLSTFSRRRFLSATFLGVGTVALSACGLYDSGSGDRAGSRTTGGSSGGGIGWFGGGIGGGRSSGGGSSGG